MDTSQKQHGYYPQGPPPYGAAVGETFPPPPPAYSGVKVPGYENVTSQNAIVLPPAAPDLRYEGPQERREMPNLPHFTEGDVREAVSRLAYDHCCYGTAVPRDMVITEITMNSVFRYTFESFGEKRESGWCFVPYAGQFVDGPANGPAPAAWDVTAIPREYFKGSQIKTEVPHTAFVKPCHTCVGNGRIRCEHCSGYGLHRTSTPNQRTAVRGCIYCDRTGQVPCTTCQATGNLKGYVQLIVTWTNHITDYLSDTNVMPKELVREATGQKVLLQEEPQLRPITNSVDEAVNAVSKSVFAQHREFQNERILRQRHHLQVVPIASCSYKWKERSGNFCVYGFEHKVYFPEYPQKCCCGCTIL